MNSDNISEATLNSLFQKLQDQKKKREEPKQNVFTKYIQSQHKTIKTK